VLSATHVLSLHDALPISSALGWSAVGLFRAQPTATSIGISSNASVRIIRCLPVVIITCCPRVLSVSALFLRRCRNPQARIFAHRSEEHTSELQSRFDVVC